MTPLWFALYALSVGALCTLWRDRDQFRDDELGQSLRSIAERAGRQAAALQGLTTDSSIYTDKDRETAMKRVLS